MRIDEAGVIKVAIVCTAAPRWVGASLSAEGVAVPTGVGWVAFAIVASLGMAVAEGFGISYVFRAWHRKQSPWLLALAVLSLLSFGLVIAMYVAANASEASLSQLFADPMLKWSWSAAVALSTVSTVAAVGIAQGSYAVSSEVAEEELFSCPNCERSFPSQKARDGHLAHCKGLEHSKNGKEPIREATGV